MRSSVSVLTLMVYIELHALFMSYGCCFAFCTRVKTYYTRIRQYAGTKFKPFEARSLLINMDLNTVDSEK